MTNLQTAPTPTTVGERPRVLCVDDDRSLLDGLRRQFHREFEITGVASGEQALEVLREAGPFAVVVSDMNMPGMNGIELLSRARKVAPDTPRVLLTGHADKQSAIQAINDVGLYQYLEKPWDNSQLLLVIQSAIERTQLLRKLRSKVEELDNAHNNLKDVQSRLLRAFL